MLIHLKYFIILFFFLFPLYCTLGQDKDTVTTAFEKLKNDSSKVILLNKKGIELRNSEPEKALLFFSKAYEIAVATGYNKGAATGLYYTGLIQKNTGKYDEAEKSYTNAKTIYETLGEQKGVAQCYNGLGQVCMYKGSYDDAIVYFQKSLYISKQNNDYKDMANALNNLGLTYMNTADYEKSLIYYLNSLKYRELACDTAGTASCHNNIGAIYYYLGKYQTALEHYKQSYLIQEKAGNKKGTAETLNNIGAAYYSMLDYENSASYYREALEISREINDQKGIAAALSNLGLIDEVKEDYTDALKNYLEALKIYEELQDQKGIATNQYYIGTVYSKKNDIAKAIEYIEKSIVLAEELKIYDVLKEAYRNLSETYEKSGNINKALENYKLYTSIKDSVLNIETSKKLTEAQTKYESDKKEKENALLEKEKKVKELELARKQNQLFSQRLLFAAVIVIVVFLSLVIYILYRNKAIKKRNKLQQELNLYMQKALSQQMNPHFIFNTVNSIQYYILNNDKVASNKYLTMFAKLMRMTLENSQHHLIPIQNEVQALNLYLELESLRFEGKFEYKITLDEESDISLYKTPTLLIQPYVENSIWHGLMHKEGVGKISVDITLVENKAIRKNLMVKCTIEDNGIGREKATEIKQKKNTAHKSLGTKITENRLRLINSLYGSDMSVNYTDLKDENGNATGTRVEICFPVLE